MKEINIKVKGMMCEGCENRIKNAVSTINGVESVEIKVNPMDSNNVIGHKKQNIIKLKKTYDVDLILRPDSKIKQGKWDIKIVE